jgi:hypothetical protein
MTRLNAISSIHFASPHSPTVNWAFFCRSRFRSNSRVLSRVVFSRLRSDFLVKGGYMAPDEQWIVVPFLDMKSSSSSMTFRRIRFENWSKIVSLFLPRHIGPRGRHPRPFTPSLKHSFLLRILGDSRIEL